MNIAK
jgi:hypothetical protein